MNNTFSIKRFGFLIREILAEKKLSLIGIFVSLSAFHMVLGFVFGFPYAYPDFRKSLIVTCFYIGTFAIALLFVKRFDKSAVGLRSFMLPVSTLEKWLSVLLFFTGFILIFNLLFKIGDTLLISLMKSHINSLEYDTLRDTQALEKLKPYSLTGHLFRTVALFSALLAAWLLTASSYFKKNKMVMSLFMSFVALCLIFIINWGINYLLIGLSSGLDQHTPFANSNFELTNGLQQRNYIRLETGDSQTIYLNYVIPLVTAFLFIIYYFRLKETEV